MDASSPQDGRTGGLRVFALALALIAGYMAARYFVYRALPVERERPMTYELALQAEQAARQRVASWHQRFGDDAPLPASAGAIALEDARWRLTHEFDWGLWFRRDLWMSIPRILFFLGCLAVMAGHGGLRAWGWRRDCPLLPAGLLACDVAGYVGQFAARAKATVFSGGQAAVGWLATLPVAFSEETCFRGLVFLSLLGRLSPRKSAVISSALFAAYHLQAQSIGEWPYIFLTGFIYCGAIYRGTGLPWLILAHEVVDGVWFHFGTNGALPRVHPLLDWASFALLAAASLWGWRLLRRDAPAAGS